MTKSIWMINHHAVTPSTPAGTRHYDFAKELLKRGYKVTIFASNKKPVSESEKTFTVELVDGISFVWIKTMGFEQNNAKRVLDMFEFSGKVLYSGRKLDLEKPDYVIGSSVHLFACLSAYWLAKKFRKPFFLEIRDIWPKTLTDAGISKFHPFVILLEILERFLYRKADKIISLFPDAEEYFVSKGAKPGSVHWISNGVDTEKHENVKALGFGETGKTFHLVYMGQIGRVNNLSVLVEAASIIEKKHPEVDASIHIYGKGPARTALKNQVIEKKLKNVIVEGAVPKSEVPKILKSADALVLTYKKLGVHNYGISFNKLFDYMASGKPIVYACGTLKNHVQESGGGISIESESADKLAEGIIEMIRHSPTEREEMGESAKNYVKTRFSIPILVNRLEKMFD